MRSPEDSPGDDPWMRFSGLGTGVNRPVVLQLGLVGQCCKIVSSLASAFGRPDTRSITGRFRDWFCALTDATMEP